ncbi:MAG: acyltransferase [Caulobacteraceae bacterium]|nr:acyltransferase [Caulobacteraceae bacterium]
MDRLRSIQHLRALAALSVVLYHACQWSNAGFAIGAAGVDVFFIISGFSMWMAVQDRDLSIKDFLRRRVWRVVPAYWLVTLILTALALAWPRLFPHVYVQPLHLLLSLAFIPHTDPVGLPFPLLPVGWSLNYEAIFYLLVAASLAEIPRRRFGRIGWSLAGVALFGVIVRPTFYLFANPMMFQFLAGAAIARALLQRRLPRHGAGWGLLAAGLGAFFYLSFFDLYGSLWRPFLWGAPAALIVAGAVSLEAQGSWGRSRALEGLGEASYSIYLCHWPVVVALSQIVGVRQPWLFVPLAFVLSVAAGLVCWRLVERPLAGLWRSPPRANPTPGSAAPIPTGSASMRLD